MKKRGLFFIGNFRRFLFLPYPCKWNVFVRDFTAKLDGTWFLRSKIIVAGFMFLAAGCEILPSSKQPASYGSGPMSIEYLQHSTTPSWGIVDINVSGFTRGAYHLWVKTESRSQTNGLGSWFVPSGSLTPVEVLFKRDRSGAPDLVTIVIENDFDATAPEYSRAVLEVTYQ